MATNPAPRHTCSILPPHLLENLARSADARVARAAERTLDLGRAIRTRRESRFARPPGDRAGGRGIVPDTLQRRASPPAPEETERDAAGAAPAPQRSVFDAQEGTDLPGRLVRDEGGDPSDDESVNEAYDGLGATWTLYQEAYERDSLDGAGLRMLATVHYEKDFDNAFWDGEQMVFGDGDGIYFNSFTDCVDVIGHELTHGVTQFTAELTYVGQSGALNESMSDVFGSLVKQHAAGETAEQADWLIGERLFTDKVNGVALRSMKAPGTAYDDPDLGKDPQPADMDGFVTLPHDRQHDNGGVHINSGIPNRAFHLAATAIGGNAWESAGQVWYDVLTGGSLPRDSDFAGFAEATIAAAASRFGEGDTRTSAIREAWTTVKVLKG